MGQIKSFKGEFARLHVCTAKIGDFVVATGLLKVFKFDGTQENIGFSQVKVGVSQTKLRHIIAKDAIAMCHTRKLEIVSTPVVAIGAVSGMKYTSRKNDARDTAIMSELMVIARNKVRDTATN